LDTFVAKQMKRLDNNWNHRELSSIGRYGQWQDMQEEIIRERAMELADGRANDWEEDMTNGWFKFAGAAAAVAAALNGEDSEDLDNDDDVTEHHRKRKAEEEKDKEADSDRDDGSEDYQKPPAKKSASEDKTPRGA
jgi:hypothetical protein